MVAAYKCTLHNELNTMRWLQYRITQGGPREIIYTPAFCCSRNETKNTDDRDFTRDFIQTDHQYHTIALLRTKHWGRWYLTTLSAQ